MHFALALSLLASLPPASAPRFEVLDDERRPDESASEQSARWRLAARGIRREQWWGRYFMPPKARQIGRNMGIGDGTGRQ